MGAPDRPDWLRSTLLAGKHGDEYLPIVTDADGNLYAVLQGEYAGVLRTVKLDSDGRLSAFVIDSRDAWGQMLSIGNAELAARLVGVPFTFDRRGQVAFADTFANGVTAWTIASMPDGGVVTDPTQSLSGGYSAHMTASADPFCLAQMDRYLFSPPSSGKVGLAAIIKLATLPVSFTINLYVEEGTTIYSAIVRFTTSTSKIAVWAGGSDYTDVGTWYTTGTANESFRFFKVVIDPITGHFTRILVDDTEIDVSAYSLVSGGSTDRGMRVYVTAKGDATTAIDILIDAVLITTQEPDNA